MIEKNWKEIIKPGKLEIVEGTFTNTYARFNAQPLERGFGVTIGNSLRRILLSSIYGSAIIGVRFDESLGVLHEFSSIPGIYEDVTDIILNLKKVILKMHTDKPQVVSLEKTGPCEVTAGDIATGGNIDVINPDQHIATIENDMTLKMEMRVDWGRGYVPAEINKEKIDTHGWIAIDAIFSPVRRVSFNVTPTIVGRRTDYDRLSLEVWTNGVVTPDDALAYAAKINKEYMDSFINFQEEELERQASVDEKEKDLNNNLFRTVEELELSVRSANCLKNANMTYIYELVQKSEAELLKTKNFGRKSLEEIKEKLAKMGLHIGMKIPNLPSPDEIEERRKRMEEEESK
ncbi:MAG: DNA-directed RNA polymerase subunit alpha [Bacteriovoracaceae bacterium]|nr:DNA-directed RNA polymerase subunit alpha [Bacteriovoracaceae bacterium]HNR50877.1 DNA-directed RNA polymerase subunit alpha [Deltaproteobacteria bacterium]